MSEILNNSRLFNKTIHKIITFMLVVYFIPSGLFALSWGEQNSQTDENLYDIYFIDQLGFSVGDKGTIVGTNDGETWQIYNSNTIEDLTALTLKKNNGVIYAYAVGKNGTFLRWQSNDQNWTPFKINNNDLYGIYFLDHLNGFASGENGIILKTIDGGDNWDSVYTSDSASTIIRDFYFVSESRGFAVGGDYIWKNFLLETTDSGKTWNSILDFIENNLYAIEFLNDSVGIAVGSNNYSIETTDGGDTWSKYYIHIPNMWAVLTDVIASNDSTLFVVASAAILKSTDLEQHWETYFFPWQLQYNLYSLAFVNSYTSYIAGGHGVILRSCPLTEIKTPDVKKACAGSTLYFESGTYGANSYTWLINEDTVQTGENDSLTYTFTEDGEYIITLLAYNETCYDEDTVHIFIYPLPEVDLGPDTIIYNPDSYILDAGNDGVFYTWYLNGNTLDSDSSTFEVSVITGSSGYYSVNVENEFGCINSDTVFIEIRVVSIEKHLANEINLNVYPNPAFSEITVSYFSKYDSEIIIYNSEGSQVKNVKKFQTGPVIHNFELKDTPPGLYIIEVKSKDQKFEQKFILK